MVCRRGARRPRLPGPEESCAMAPRDASNIRSRAMSSSATPGYAWTGAARPRSAEFGRASGLPTQTAPHTWRWEEPGCWPPYLGRKRQEAARARPHPSSCLTRTREPALESRRAETRPCFPVLRVQHRALQRHRPQAALPRRPVCLRPSAFVPPLSASLLPRRRSQYLFGDCAGRAGHPGVLSAPAPLPALRDPRSPHRAAARRRCEAGASSLHPQRALCPNQPRAAPLQAPWPRVSTRRRWPPRTPVSPCPISRSRARPVLWTSTC